MVTEFFCHYKLLPSSIEFKHLHVWTFAAVVDIRCLEMIGAKIYCCTAGFNFKHFASRQIVRCELVQRDASVVQSQVRVKPFLARSNSS